MTNIERERARILRVVRRVKRELLKDDGEPGWTGMLWCDAVEDAFHKIESSIQVKPKERA